MATMDGATYEAMPHQVGGHATEKTSMRAFGGEILKPFQSGQRGEHEHGFYVRVFEAEETKDWPVYQQLRPLLPQYRGLVEVPEFTSGAVANGLHPGKYLALEDLTWGRSMPCIMDVKVGTRSYEDSASAEKIAYEQHKFPLQTSVGFRVQGIKVFDPRTQQYVEYDKHAGRRPTTASEIVTLLAQYLPMHDVTCSKALLTAFITRLESFHAWFQVQDQHEFIASSLLFLYDGKEAGSTETTRGPDIRLIDFAHVQSPSPSRVDEGVLLGIRVLLSSFRQLMEECSR